MTQKRHTFPLTLIALILWLILGYVIFYLSPTTNTIIAFHILLFSALTVSSEIIFGINRHSFLIILGVIILLALRATKMAHVINIFLLIAILFTLEVLLSKR